MGQLVYCFGRDIVNHKSGAESYIEAHAMSASRVGLKPVQYALGRRNEVEDIGFAEIVRRRSPGKEYRSEFVQLYRHLLVGPIVERLRDEPGPHVIHSFGSWAAAGADAADKLRAKGVDVKHVSTCWELMGPHTRSKFDNGVIKANPLKYARQRLLLEWVLRSALPAERSAMQRSEVTVVNYKRLARLIHEEYDPAINVVELPYSSMTAFDPVLDEYPYPQALADLAVKDGPVVVATSRHAPRKGVDVLIRALAQLRDEGVPFRAVLVGKGALLEDHRDLVRELKLDDRVALPGLVPDVREYLAHGDILSLPSLAEGSGSVSVLEALQFGLAVVSCAVDGMVEDLTDGEDSLLVETGSIPAMAEGLRALLTDPELRERIGRGGREMHDRRFSAEAATRALAEFYAGLGLEPTSAAVPVA